MAAIARRSVMAPVSRIFTLATADDINGVQDNTKSFDVTGALRVIVVQENNGTLGPVLVSGALNAAGVEPVNAAVFKFGPYEGPTAIRVFRYVTDEAASAAWVTGAPKVFGLTVGQTAGTAVAP